MFDHDHRIPTGSWTGPIDREVDLAGIVATIVFDAVAVGATVVWTAFWGMVMFIHFQQGDYGGLLMTGMAFVLPAVGLLAWYLHGDAARLRRAAGTDG